jgi:hypothetical protein
MPLSMWPLGVSIRPEYFRFLNASASGLIVANVVVCVICCIIGVADMEVVFGPLSSSSSESVDIETSDAESSLWMTVVVSMAGMTWISPMLGWACAGEESAEVESADDDSASGDVSLSGDSIILRMRGIVPTLGMDTEVKPSTPTRKMRRQEKQASTVNCIEVVDQNTTNQGRYCAII